MWRDSHGSSNGGSFSSEGEMSYSHNLSRSDAHDAMTHLTSSVQTSIQILGKLLQGLYIPKKSGNT